MDDTVVYICTCLMLCHLVYMQSVNICALCRIVRATLHLGFRPSLKHGSIARGSVVMVPSITFCGAMRGGSCSASGHCTLPLAWAQ